MKQVRLRRRPAGQITTGDFVVDGMAELGETAGRVVTRTTHISLDPYLALRMRAEIPERSDGPPYPIVGRTIGEVVDPGFSEFAVHDTVLGFGQWRAYDARPAADLRRIDIGAVPVAAHLGAVGHSGFTAWLGLSIGKAAEGETFVVSGAAGAVGSVAGQLAKQRGCRVIGIAGGADKVDRVVGELGFDACLDHRVPDLAGRLRELAPDGIDLHFENVGANTLDPVLANMRRRGRIVLCGLMQHYQDVAPVALRNFRLFLERSIRLEPFSIYDHQDRFNQAYRDLIGAAQAGALRFTQTVTEGMDQVPGAFVAMLGARGIGKHVAKVG